MKNNIHGHEYYGMDRVNVCYPDVVVDQGVAYAADDKGRLLSFEYGIYGLDLNTRLIHGRALQRLGEQFLIGSIGGRIMLSE
ncbi:MAG: hypothetical protein OEZ68_15495 [Gammaproteobacteria bacterium]|nr:hypothetical protein [Gammaproteobacteria bacterium]MDH5802206.1 hypothetical protein [Gammaproteobacteria bacterium]